MSQKAQQEPPKLNSLIPMEDTDGNRCFVNQWDVPARKVDGWIVVGTMEHHTSKVGAPVDALTTGDGKGKVDGKGGKGKPPVPPVPPPAPPAQ